MDDPFVVGDVVALKIACAWLLRAVETHLPAEAAARAQTLQLLINTVQVFPLDGLAPDEQGVVRGRAEATLDQLMRVGFRPAPP